MTDDGEMQSGSELLLTYTPEPGSVSVSRGHVHENEDGTVTWYANEEHRDDEAGQPEPIA